MKEDLAEGRITREQLAMPYKALERHYRGKKRGSLIAARNKVLAELPTNNSDRPAINSDKK
jgi:hypothetical protein